MSQDVGTRLALMEQRQKNYEDRQVDLKNSQEVIANDMKETSGALRRLAVDISTLVTNVTHLTTAVEKIHESSSSMRSLEIELAGIKSDTSSVRRLWTNYEELRLKVESQTVVTRAAQIIGAAMVVSLIGIVVAKLFGGG